MEYYATSQLAFVPLIGVVHDLPVKGLLDRISPSPDGKYALVSALHRPFSYTVPYERFPLLTEVVTVKTGENKKTLRPPRRRQPAHLARRRRARPRATTPGAAMRPATLTWVEAADGGDPKVKTEVRDRLVALNAPFTGQPTTLLELSMRLQRGYGGGGGGIEWGNDHLAIATESRWADRRTRTIAFDPSQPGKVTTLYDGSSQDRYHNPGRPVTTHE